jgi:hypothetical protein
MACSALEETLDSFTSGFIETLAESGVIDTTTKTMLTTIAAAFLLNFFQREAHLKAAHPGAEVNAWRQRVFDEARLVVYAVSSIGVADERNLTLGKAAAECAERAMRGENVVLRLGEDSWFVYLMTDADIAAHREALDRGDPSIRLSAKGAEATTPTQEQSTQLPAKLEDAAATSFLEAWSPGSKAS